MTAERPPKKPAPAAVNLPEFLSTDLIPLLTKEMQAAGCNDLVIEAKEAQVTARWEKGINSFTLFFDEGTVEGRKTLSCSRAGKGEIVQMFMPPERGFTKVDSGMIVGLLVLKFSSTLSWIKKPVA